jgi:hypothetical protein
MTRRSIAPLWCRLGRSWLKRKRTSTDDKIDQAEAPEGPAAAADHVDVVYVTLDTHGAIIGKGAIGVTAPLQAAIAYARIGLPVLPLWSVVPGISGLVCACGNLLCKKPGKHPLARLVGAEHGVNSATTDEKLLMRWWTARPDANVGIAGGRLVILDIDPRHNGDRSLAELERKHGALPPTWRASTGGGGLHIYFATPTADTKVGSNRAVAPGIDIRTKGGFVVAPPSRHVSGRSYAWEHNPHRAPLATLPVWLATLINPPPPPRPAQPSNEHQGAKLSGILRVVARAREGERNNVTYWGACRLAEMVAAGMLTRDHAIALAIEAATRTGLSRNEALRTTQSAFRGLAA